MFGQNKFNRTRHDSADFITTKVKSFQPGARSGGGSRKIFTFFLNILEFDITNERLYWRGFNFGNVTLNGSLLTLCTFPHYNTYAHYFILTNTLSVLTLSLITQKWPIFKVLLTRYSPSGRVTQPRSINFMTI